MTRYMLRFVTFVMAWACCQGATWARDPLIGAEISISLPIADNASRALWVSLPPDYEQAAGRRYPVMYVLDGRGLFPIATASARFLSVFEGAPEMIVVGIDSASQAARRRDFTPVRAPADAEDVSGHADSFSAFLVKTVLPRVERDFRADGRSILVGHSLAGLFTLDARLKGLPAFDGYIAISPTLPWAGNEIMNRIERQPRESGAEKGPFVFVSMAADTPSYVTQMDRLQSLTSGVASDWHLARFPDETHVSTIPVALVRALRAYHQGDAATEAQP